MLTPLQWKLVAKKKAPPVGPFAITGYVTDFKGIE